MTQSEEIQAGETILRRFPDHPDNTIHRSGGGLRATSRAIRPRKSERYPSWSRESLSSPESLLAIEAAKGRDVSAWCVAAVGVAPVRELGLDVVADPTLEDPGHCLIVDTPRQSFTKVIWSKLARETTVVHPNLDEPR